VARTVRAQHVHALSPYSHQAPFLATVSADSQKATLHECSTRVFFLATARLDNSSAVRTCSSLTAVLDS
jgi:hypothetical protein